ncbi:MAG: hypothetical protein WCL70_08450 [Paludibacter sp.]
MKKSSKLLLGLIIAIISGIVVLNVVYKIKHDSKRKKDAAIINSNNANSGMQDSTSIKTDSTTFKK